MDVSALQRYFYKSQTINKIENKVMKKIVMSALMLAVSAAFVAADNAQAASVNQLNNMMKEVASERCSVVQEMCHRGKRHVKHDRHVKRDRHCRDCRHDRRCRRHRHDRRFRH